MHSCNHALADLDTQTTIPLSVTEFTACNWSEILNNKNVITRSQLIISNKLGRLMQLIYIYINQLLFNVINSNEHFRYNLTRVIRRVTFIAHVTIYLFLKNKFAIGEMLYWTHYDICTIGS